MYYVSNIKLSIEDCHSVAASKGGKCLSTEYKNVHSLLEWCCCHGHIWKSSLQSVRRKNSWCRECQTISEKQYNEIAINNGGYCIRPPKNLKSKGLWRCNCGHEWEANGMSIFYRKTWCPRCSWKKSVRKVNKPSIKFHWSTNEELTCQGSYEAKVVDYLNTNKINYKWQPKTFTLSTGKTYRPDLYLVDQDLWVEIKGYFRDDAKAKWDEFKSYYSSELWDKKKLKELKIL